MIHQLLILFTYLYSDVTTNAASTDGKHLTISINSTTGKPFSPDTFRNISEW